MLTRLVPSRGERGFSLAEMLVAMVIFAVLASIAIPVYINQRNKSIIETLKTDLVNASLVMEEKRAANNGRYPDKLPREVSFDKNATVTYTFPAGRAAYCLQMTLRGKKMQVSSASNTPVNVTTGNDCSYGVSLAAPRVTGQLTNDNIPRLSWENVSGAVSYNVYANNTLKTTVPAGQANYTVNLARQEGGTTVNYRVAAVSATSTEGELSRAVQLVAPLLPPTLAPTLSLKSSTPTPSGELEAVLKWTAVPTATKYELYDATTGDVIAVVPGTTYTVNVPMGQNKAFYVIPFNDAGAGPQSNEVTVQGPVLPAPTLTGTINSNRVTTLTWDLVSGATSYRIYRDGAVFNNVTFNGSGKATVAAAYSTPGSVYSYRVAAVDSRAREGQKSNEVNIGVESTKPVLSVASTRVTDAGVTLPTLTWQAVTGATQYEVYFTGASNPTAYLSGTTTKREISVGADPSNSRSYYIIAVGPWGKSQPSNTVTINGISPTFSGLNYKQKGEGIAGVTLNWTNQPYAESYEITITGGSSPVTYNIAKGTTAWSTSDTYLGNGASNVIRTFSVKALYKGGVSSPAQAVEVFMPGRPTNLVGTKGTVKHTTSRWTFTWVRPGGTSQSRVKLGSKHIYTTLSTEKLEYEVPHDTNEVLEIRVWSPDEKMLSQPATRTVNSPHPASWHASTAEYDFLGTGPGIMARYLLSGTNDQLYFYKAAANGAIGAWVAIGERGWDAMKHITPVYDWQGKGSAGIFAVDRATGRAYYHGSLGAAGANTRSMTKQEIGSGRNWANFRQIAYVPDWGGEGAGAILAVNTNGTVYRFKVNSDGTIVNSSKQVASGFGEIANASNWDGAGRDDIFMRDADGNLWLYRLGDDTIDEASRVQIGIGWKGYSFQPYEAWGGVKGVQAAISSDGTHWWYPYRASGHGINASARVQNGSGWQGHWETGAGKSVSCSTSVCN